MAAVSFLAAAAFLAAAQPLAPPVSGEQASPSAIRARHEVCYILAAAGAYPALNLADCLSFDQAPDAAFKTQVCNFLRETDQLEAFDFASHSACFRNLLVR
jgi:hypothetical protein